MVRAALAALLHKFNRIFQPFLELINVWIRRKLRCLRPTLSNVDATSKTRSVRCALRASSSTKPRVLSWRDTSPVRLRSTTSEPFSRGIRSTWPRIPISIRGPRSSRIFQESAMRRSCERSRDVLPRFGYLNSRDAHSSAHTIERICKRFTNTSFKMFTNGRASCELSKLQSQDRHFLRFNSLSSRR